MARKQGTPLIRRRPRARREGAHVPQWLAQAAQCAPRAMLCANETLIVENCEKVVEFAPERVLLDTKIGIWTVCGSDLRICRESEHTAVVYGRIDSLCTGEARR